MSGLMQGAVAVPGSIDSLLTLRKNPYRDPCALFCGGGGSFNWHQTALVLRPVSGVTIQMSAIISQSYTNSPDLFCVLGVF